MDAHTFPDAVEVVGVAAGEGVDCGAAGGVEAIFSALSVRDQVAPPTANLASQDPACDLDYVPNNARRMPIRAALSNSFGFGGTNGTLIFRRA